MKKTIFCLLIALIVSFGIYFFYEYTKGDISVFGDDTKTIIIDAGHGYPDGGAVAKDGTVESEINLTISKKLCKKLENIGFECIMTREDENGIYDNGGTIHAKKVSDIRNRVKIANSNKSALVISIHLNTFPDSSVQGAQVFYKSDSSLSKELANEIQNSFNLNFQQNSPRTIKKISSNIYFFNHICNDSILIECGFLTNSQDLESLKSDEFGEILTDNIAEVISYKFLRK